MEQQLTARRLSKAQKSGSCARKKKTKRPLQIAYIKTTTKHSQPICFKHTKSPRKHMAPATETDAPSQRVRGIQEHINKALAHTSSARRANLQAKRILTGDPD